MLAVPEQSFDHVAGLLTAYSVALDKGELEIAGDYLDQALERHLYYPALFRSSLLLEGAYFEAYVRQQANIARAWFDKIEETALTSPYALLRAESAVLLAEGKLAEAQSKAEKGLESAQRDRFMIGSAITEIERLQTLLHNISAAST